MRIIVIAALVAMPLAVHAQQKASSAPEGRGFHQRVYERYCAKLREGPQEYVQFVHRMKTVHGYNVNDFAPEYRGARVLADCGVSPERVAAVYRLLERAS